jgi:hypothetical protein
MGEASAAIGEDLCSSHFERRRGGKKNAAKAWRRLIIEFTRFLLLFIILLYTLKVTISVKLVFVSACAVAA